MGISIAYRGRLADLTRIEDFEDRLLDLAPEVGGLAQGRSIFRRRRSFASGIVPRAGCTPTITDLDMEGWRR